MRLATYVALVIRRIWARKLMLLGSFLGATLVTALLVVLPLYEASVQAVDLLFTFRQAPARTVAISAVQTSTDYSPAVAESGRDAVESAAEPLRRWYPDIEERLLSREFTIIPLDFPDWLGLAEAWREAVADPSVTDPGPPPYPTPPQEATVTRILSAPDIVDRVEVVEGGFVLDQAPVQEPDPIMDVVIGEDLARLTGLGVGDRTVLRSFTSQPDWFEMVEVSGIVRPVDPTSVLWDATRPGELILVDVDSFDAWSGAFPIDPEQDPWLRDERGFRRLTVSQTFSLALDRDTVALENVEDLSNAVTGFIRNVAQAEGIRTITDLTDIVAEFDTRSVVFGAPILAMLALIVAGALYFLIYMASLALEREASELSLLRMRGATSGQTVGIHLLQSLVIAVGAALVAPVVARAMVSLTGRIPPMSDLTGGDALTVAQSRPLLPFAVAGGALTFIAMGLAILPLARRSILELRALASRPAHQSVWQKYYLDLFLVVLAGVILFELRQQGIVDTDTSDLGLDPFSVAAPALFLFAGALLMLRLLPFVLGGLGWVLTRFRGMTAALPGWHLGRNPIPYGRLALLVWLTTGFGAFALTYAATLEQSYEDRAVFAVGSDVRLVGDDVGYLDAPGVATVSPVYRTTGAARLSSRTSEVVAVDPRTFPDVVAWRDDFAPAPGGPEATVGVPALGAGVDWGVDLPDGTTELAVEGLVVPQSAVQRAAAGPRPAVRVMVRLVDAVGRFRIHRSAEPLTDGGWQTVTIPLDGATAIPEALPDGDDLVLESIWLEDDDTSVAVTFTEVLVDSFTATAPSGATDLLPLVLAEMRPASGLESDFVAGDRAAQAWLEDVPDGDESVFEFADALTRDGDLWSLAVPTRTRVQPVPHLTRPPERLPFVIDATVARNTGLVVGSQAFFGVDGTTIEGEVTALVDLVPTTGDPRFEGVIVTQLAGLTQWVSGTPPWSHTGTPARALEPTELWVATDDPDAAVSLLTAGVETEPEEVLSADGAAADFSSRPIQVGLVSILFVGTGAGVVLALAGVTGYVLVAVRRRTREMGVLRALGFRRRGVAGTFATEQLVVLGVGAAIGVVAGIGLMRLMIPFLQLGEDAAELLPPALMQVPGGTLGLYLVVVTGLLVGSVLWSTRSVSARRLSEVLREVER
ncbi:MAG: FtsX-like permease family protein [Acidimicrobiia bacterium]|nr:FtsX-like permease family protein [Acidimicrobiia bacterium]